MLTSLSLEELRVLGSGWLTLLCSSGVDTHSFYKFFSCFNKNYQFVNRFSDQLEVFLNIAKAVYPLLIIDEMDFPCTVRTTANVELLGN